MNGSPAGSGGNRGPIPCVASALQLAGVMPRRALHAMVSTLLCLGALEGFGRTWPDPRTIPGIEGNLGLDFPYDPGSRLVAEAIPGTRTFLRGGNTFHNVPWRVPRAPGTHRIIAVGDSTVFGVFPEALRQGITIPGRQLEVLNFGVRSIASDRVRMAAAAAVQQDADLLLVYVGHNELLEARLNPQSLEPFGRRAVRSAVRNSGIGRLIQHFLPRPPVTAEHDTEPDPREFGPVTGEEWARVARSWRANLTAICALAREAKVPVAFIEPISSLIKVPELSAAHDPGKRIALATIDAVARVRKEPVDTDIEAIAAAVSADAPGTAPALYLAGLAHLVRGRTELARAPLEAARASDEHPWRTSAEQLAILREVAAGCDAAIIATAPAFDADPRYLDIHDPLFVDQVHPSDDGVRVLASVVAAGLLPLLPAGSSFDLAKVTIRGPRLDHQRGFRVPE